MPSLQTGSRGGGQDTTPLPCPCHWGRRAGYLPLPLPLPLRRAVTCSGYYDGAPAYYDGADSPSFCCSLLPPSISSPLPTHLPCRILNRHFMKDGHPLDARLGDQTKLVHAVRLEGQLAAGQTTVKGRKVMEGGLGRGKGISGMGATRSGQRDTQPGWGGDNQTSGFQGPLYRSRSLYEEGYCIHSALTLTPPPHTLPHTLLHTLPRRSAPVPCDPGQDSRVEVMCVGDSDDGEPRPGQGRPLKQVVQHL